ncbi:SHOCT domain-containing protein [Paenibacillus sp. FSL R7-0333]|uniref:SHOCT domain-containing protein n=1 Tax=Paenibacillus sp. FSL R7-0333 TaxID=1926587 RepID=UPI00096C56F4|nr:hypothetical protein BK146_32270 [Paenibacillus sp. FSL R7-0333]
MSNTDDKTFLLGCMGSIALFILLWMITGNPILAFIIGGGVALVTSWYAKRKKTEQNYNTDKQLYWYLDEVKDFKASKYHISEDKKFLVAIDETSKKVCFIDNNYGIAQKVYSYRDLIKSEITEDGESVTTTSRTSQLGGVLLGGMIAGGTGAAVGALSASKSTKSEIKAITLKITVNDTKNPVYYIKFLFVIEAVRKNTPKYQNAIKEANHWHGLISVLIRRADAELQDTKQKELVSALAPNSIKEEASVSTVSASVADELVKLGELMKQGLITSEEFSEMKKKLLSQI